MHFRFSSSRSVRRAAVAALLCSSALLAGACRPAGNAEATTEASADRSREAVLTVTVTELAPVELTRSVTVNGSIFAWQEVIIAPEVGGYRVAEVNVDVGDHVRRGETLVELSTALLDAEVATKQAVLRQREAELLNADAAFTRAQSLFTMNLLSRADLDRLNAEALSSRAAVESAKADLEASTLRLKFTKVTAPDDGVITSRTVTVGQIAQAGSEMLRLLRDNRIEWRGEVPEARLGALKAGQPVKVTAADGTVFEGTIRVVAPTITSSNRTGLVYVELAPDERLRPGMFARGEIAIGKSPAFTVPLQSVVSSDGYSFLFVLRPDKTVERRRVETGAVRDAEIEVVSGVKQGERIVVRGAGFLKDGDLVNVGVEGGS